MDSVTCIDIGNQRAKFGTFDSNGQLLNHGVFSSESSETINQQIDSFLLKGQNVLICDVSNRLSENWHSVTGIKILQANTPLPFVNNYKTPGTLGLDRVCGISGALLFFPNQPCMVLSIGTCLTIDMVDAAGIYKGGNISPGLSLRYKSLHEFTGKLPMVENRPTQSPMGETTEEAILNGVQIGMLAEIEHYIAHGKSVDPSIQVIFSGGDALYFEKQVKTKIFAAPLLNLYGLYNIFKHDDFFKKS